ncbi:MAG: DUF5131 family protein, partial [Gammaproteobacteria bacterium]|nr:DUF5131 family protein [Gammaproteobacteria bacterium]
MSKIQWCDETINPIVGCSKVSPACLNCYAEAMARRQCHIPTTAPETRKAYQSVIDEDGKWNGRTAYVPSGRDKLKSLAN